VSGLPHRALGASGIEVSPVALGSWRTYERIPREQGVAVMRAARDRGINFLDDARYDDETGKAPMRSGYSEVVFGELFRAAGWKRDDVVVANKLWWEFWPAQSAAEELDGSLQRMGFEYLDVAYSWSNPNGPSVEEIVASVGDLIAAGKLRAWGTGNWEPAQHAAAADIARREGMPQPCAAQLPYNLTVREHVEGTAAVQALNASGAAVVASFVLFGGVLTGKYAGGSTRGRMTDELDKPELQQALRAADALVTLAGKVDATPAALAIAFAVANPRVAAVLFGATTAEQVAENVRAVELLDRLGPAEFAELRGIGL
jgi:aryl-alcohol dehydrogenase-like predicted oxidoreductase